MEEVFRKDLVGSVLVHEEEIRKYRDVDLVLTLEKKDHIWKLIS